MRFCNSHTEITTLRCDPWFQEKLQKEIYCDIDQYTIKSILKINDYKNSIDQDGRVDVSKKAQKTMPPEQLALVQKIIADPWLQMQRI